MLVKSGLAAGLVSPGRVIWFLLISGASFVGFCCHYWDMEGSMDEAGARLVIIYFIVAFDVFFYYAAVCSLM